MLQFMIWALCVVILALGYIAKLVFALTLPAEKRTPNSGTGIFAFFLLLAAAIFILSIIQGQEIQSLLGR